MCLSGRRSVATHEGSQHMFDQGQTPYQILDAYRRAKTPHRRDRQLARLILARDPFQAAEVLTLIEARACTRISEALRAVMAERGT